MKCQFGYVYCFKNLQILNYLIFNFLRIKERNMAFHTQKCNIKWQHSLSLFSNFKKYMKHFSPSSIRESFSIIFLPKDVSFSSVDNIVRLGCFLDCYGPPCTLTAMIHCVRTCAGWRFPKVHGSFSPYHCFVWWFDYNWLCLVVGPLVMQLPQWSTWKNEHQAVLLIKNLIVMTGKKKKTWKNT